MLHSPNFRHNHPCYVNWQNWAPGTFCIPSGANWPKTLSVSWRKCASGAPGALYLISEKYVNPCYFFENQMPGTNIMNISIQLKVQKLFLISSRMVLGWQEKWPSERYQILSRPSRYYSRTLFLLLVAGKKHKKKAIREIIPFFQDLALFQRKQLFECGSCLDAASRSLQKWMNLLLHPVNVNY
jgi:hypothetical protein